MFEHRHEATLLRRAFLGRMAVSVAWAGLVVAVLLGIGVVGYRWTAGLGWLDAFLDAAIILTGMRPVVGMRPDGATVFAALHDPFAGLVLLSTIAIITTPVIHRLLHGFQHRVEEGARCD